MHTALAPEFAQTAHGLKAQEILGKCVHCGFCTATCPTYQLLGDELDGPRGRIYLIKQVLEGTPATRKTQLHLDRCLTCRNCESTCPSGVEYGKLVDIGRQVVEQQVPRPAAEKAVRWALKEGMTRPALFNPAMKLGQAVRGFLPQVLKNKIPKSAKFPAQVPKMPRAVNLNTEPSQFSQTMLMLEGCVQPAMSPNINAATRRVLNACGVNVISAPRAGCCGAIRHHLNEHDVALNEMRANINAWWPAIEAGATAIVMNASGCGAMVKDYGYLLRDDAQYAAKAKRVSELCQDISVVLPQFESILKKKCTTSIEKIAYHPPCTLQHGQQIRGQAENLLRALGVEVKLCADSHLCCGSAGTYSVLQPEIAYQLRDNKLRNLLTTQPSTIASANIGCISHLQSGTDTPVLHWIEIIDNLLQTQV